LSRREVLRLGDIREAIATIRGHIASGSFDRKTSDAVLYNLVVIGEAAAQISDGVAAGRPVQESGTGCVISDTDQRSNRELDRHRAEVCERDRAERREQRQNRPFRSPLANPEL
jgi:hypothetical protein